MNPAPKALRKTTPNRFRNSAHSFRSFAYSFSASLRARIASACRFQNAPDTANASCCAFSLNPTRDATDFRDESEAENAESDPALSEEADKRAAILENQEKKKGKKQKALRGRIEFVELLNR